MPRVPYNAVFKMQQNKLVPATFKKASISSYNASSRTVNVTFSENPNVIIRGIPIAKHVTAAMCIQGANCRIDLFSETVNGSMCLAYVF